MKQLPLISVIVPVYNVEKWLERCVWSICNQTYSNLDIILVDDGSTDDSGRLCDSLGKKDSRIRVIHKKNGGLSDARNAGLQIAQGTYICFIDSDDWVSIRFLEILYKALRDNQCDISECTYIKTSKTIEEKNLKNYNYQVCDKQEALKLHLYDEMFQQVVWNKLYRKNIITTIFEVGKYHEDIFWTYQIISNCKKLVHVDVPLYYYFQRNDSIMGEKYSFKRLDAVEGTEQRCKFLCKHYPELRGIAQGQFVSTCMYHNQLLFQNADVDQDGSIKKQLRNRAKNVGVAWKLEQRIPSKQKYWMKLYLTFPTFTCKIRNKLGIGL